MKSDILGVKITPLKVIKDDRGSVRHMLRNDDPHFEQFGEIYFSTIHKRAVKAWHLHRKMTLNYAVVYGGITLVLFDNRTTTRVPTIESYVLDDRNNYNLITVPPLVWNGFKVMPGESTGIVANCATLPHDPDKIERRPPNSLLWDGKPVYDWGEYDVGG